MNCGIHRVGDNGQLKGHNSCERATVVVPIKPDDIAKATALDQTRGLKWKQIYEILFPDCSESEIPSPCKISLQTKFLGAFLKKKKLKTKTKTEQIGRSKPRSQSPPSFRERDLWPGYPPFLLTNGRLKNWPVIPTFSRAAYQY